MLVRACGYFTLLVTICLVSMFLDSEYGSSIDDNTPANRGLLIKDILLILIHKPLTPEAVTSQNILPSALSSPFASHSFPLFLLGLLFSLCFTISLAEGRTLYTAVPGLQQVRIMKLPNGYKENVEIVISSWVH
jgi:hypothetical protein